MSSSPLADLPLNKAAAAAGVSPAPFKKACRKLGVRRWAYKRSCSALSISAALSGALALGGRTLAWKAAARASKNESESGPDFAPSTQTPTSFYPAASPKPTVGALLVGTRGPACATTYVKLVQRRSPEMPVPLLVARPPLLVARPPLPSHSPAQPAPDSASGLRATGVRARRRRPSGSFSRRRRWTKPWRARCWNALASPGVRRRAGGSGAPQGARARDEAPALGLRSWDLLRSLSTMSFLIPTARQSWLPRPYA